MLAEICKCACHSSNNVKHIVACCNKCPHCDRNIKGFAFEAHKTACSDKHDPKLNGVRIMDILNALKTLEDAKLDVSSITNQVNELLAGVLSEE